MNDWTEKYRPKTLDEIVGNDKAINEIKKWADSWKKGIPKKRAIIFSGRAGTGKTSSALALANEMGWTVIELNASDARNASRIKNVATSGAVNETFTSDGNFLASAKGGRKLIILDEADNLYERVSGTSDISNDLSDRGGKKAIVDTIKITNQPIVLIVNNYYNLIKGSGESLKHLCKLVKFYDPYSSIIFNLLKKISLNEGINIDQKVLKNISDRCKGDIRSAVNDLQSVCLNRDQIDISTIKVLGYRDREKDIFTVLREIFKTKNIQTLRDSVLHLDVDPKMLLLWLNENLPKEYVDREDLSQGFHALSNADMFIGHTRKTQNYRFWSYACDIMNGGIAVAKTHSYPNDTYNFPTWLRQKKNVRTGGDIKQLVIKKISNAFHNSNHKTQDQCLSYFKNMFRNNTYFAVKMKNRFELSENEVKYLLGKSHAYKLKKIMTADLPEKIKPISKQEFSDNEEEDKKEEVDEEKIQQSLFDF